MLPETRGEYDLPIPLQGTFHYRADRPFRVTLTLSADHLTLPTWVFARSLLLDGLHVPVGQGDVVVRPAYCGTAEPCVHIRLRTPHYSCVLATQRRNLADWLALTTALVPPGTEHAHFDLDAELARALARPG